MSNFIKLFAIATIAISCTTENKINNDLKDLNLSGHIKSVVLKNYSAKLKFGEITKDNIIGNTSQWIFNEDGYIIETNVFTQNDSLVMKNKNKYDNNNNNIKICYYNQKGNIDSIIVKNYSDNTLKNEKKYDCHNKITELISYIYIDNKLTETKVYNPSKFSLKKTIKYNYDETGNLIEKIDDKAIKYSVNYIYNDNGDLIEKYINNGNDLKKTYEYKNNSIISSINSKVYSKCIEKKDSTGNVIEQLTYRPDNTIEQKTTRIFDKEGKEIEEEGFYYHNGDRNYFLHRYRYKYGYKIESKTYRKPGILSDKLHYDKNGNVISLFLYDSNGRGMMSNFYKYNKQGNKIQGDLYIAGSTSTYYYDYINDSCGNIVQVNKNDKMNEKFIYKYNDNGIIIEEKKINEKKKPVYQYKFNGQKNKIEEINYNSDGIISQYNKYDDEGNIIEQIKYGDKGNPITKTINKFTDKSVKIKSIIENYDESYNLRSVYNYNELGDLIEHKTFHLNASLNSSYTYFYGERNNVIRKIIYDSKGNIISDLRMNYEFDKNNNWVKKLIKNEKDEPLYIIERDIKYYK